ncbi:hypothetical protein ANCDUO_13018 [Ancylostoma duodenale]|uniref:RRM domain-containing protein n=1 Tax=Ancylostoma duodenale TaxID=51022 RepID=A0A0C2GD42_9BILA|nr:hypothetical protein ANCDUO_13018 [Ancylostoma duodenale]
MRSSLRFLGENLRRTIVQANNGQSIGKTVYLTHVKWVTGKLSCTQCRAPRGHSYRLRAISLIRGLVVISALHSGALYQVQGTKCHHPTYLDTDQLQNYFSRYGQVRSVNMFFDAETGLHRGFASVTFENPESATRAMQQRPHVIDGDRVSFLFSQFFSLTSYF